MPNNNDNQYGFAPNEPADGRKKGEWETRYPKEARIKILWESIYLGIIFLSIPILILFFLENHCIDKFLLKFQCIDNFGVSIIKKYAYAWLGGTFGGVIFVIKWLYHSIAKNLWNEDRKLWRIFTPHLSGGLAFSMIVFISSGLLNIFDVVALNRPSTVFGIGFLTGYFSDAAIGKLSEVANTLFGATEKHKHKNIK